MFTSIETATDEIPIMSRDHTFSEVESVGKTFKDYVTSG